MSRPALSRPAWRLLSILGSLILLAGVLHPLPSVVRAAHTPSPTSVTVAGDLDSEIGCTGDWDAGCAAAHLADQGNDVWAQTFSLPAASYQYKIALNDSWDENYGAGGVQGGENIGLAAPGGDVRFYYDHKTHWIGDSIGSVIATVPGSYQSEIGCSGDWQPDCLRTLMTDVDGDNVFTFSTDQIPVGSYEFKIALNEGWDVNYGAGGTPNGANLTFNVAAAGYTVIFSYDASTHIPGVEVRSGLPAPDGNVEYDGLGHDSQDAVYRQPFGAVNPGEQITLRFRTFHDDVTGVRARFYDTTAKHEFFQTMSVVASDVTCYDASLDARSGCDYWQTTVTPSAPTTLYYRFVVTDGAATAYYADDAMVDGGWGSPTATLVDNSYAITVFDPAFEPITWMENAVIYQIFPDRFNNGRKSNDASASEPRYGYPPESLDQVLVKTWTSLPEGYCRGYVDPATPCTEEPRGRDYFGGDLKGVDQKLDYLQSVGVNTIYFNPIFSSASDHGYDTRDYLAVDPRFGTQKDWENLVKHTAQRGMHIILDGVFNHVSSDSPYFDRYGHYTAVGACESTASPYRDWFTFHAQVNGPCAGPGGPHTMAYDAWFGFDSLPVLNKNTQAVRDLVYAGTDNVAAHWLDAGASGWRLDVMNDGSFPADFWQAFRATVKSADPQAPIIGELWKKADVLPMIHGDTADTTMNYRFRNAVLGYLGHVDNKGFPDDGQADQPPSVYADKLTSIREDYPDATYYTLMNLLDSHDTERIAWTLTPGAENRESKEFNAANVAVGTARVRLAMLLQMTTPGAPTTYYGDEVGVTGDDDPDDRRTFPWNPDGTPGGNAALRAWYSQLTSLRAGNAILRTGELTFLLTNDTDRTMAYARRTGDSLAIVAVNPDTAGAHTLTIPLDGYLRDGVHFTDVINGGSYTSTGGELQVTLPALGGALLLATPGQDLTGPGAPTGLAAVAGNGTADLSWNPTLGAAEYQVLRSPLSGGGYELVGTTSGTTFGDSGLRNGTRYHYVVKGVDALGNVGAASNEAAATPYLPIGYAVIQWPKTIDITIGQTTENIYGQVYVAGLTDSGGSHAAILAQVGFGAPASDAADWTTWKAMAPNLSCGGCGDNYEYMATLRPGAVGTYDYLVRFSTDGGINWAYGDQDGFYPGESGTDMPGVLTVNASADTTAPSAPTDLAVTNWGAAFIDLAWTAPADGDLMEHWVYRSDDGAPFAVVGIVPIGDGATYHDGDVASGTEYAYRVTAVDTSLNESDPSNTVTQTAGPKLVDVTFRVRVPAGTPADATIYIPGDIDLLGPWTPDKQPLVDQGGGIWEVTLQILDGTALQYKYTRGSWDKVEWWGSITGTANRHVTISYGTDGTQLVDDTATDYGTGSDDHKAVQYWRDPLVVSTTPADGASGAAPASVEVTFAQPIQPSAADFSGSVTVSGPGGSVAGTVAPTSGTTSSLTWTPSAALGPGTYTVTVFTLKSDLGGDSVLMQAPYVFTFTVA